MIYERNNEQVEAMLISKGFDLWDVLERINRTGYVNWVRYSLGDVYDILIMDTSGNIVHTAEDTYIIFLPDHIEIMGKDKFESLYTHTDEPAMLGPAPLVDTDMGVYKLNGEYPYILEEGKEYKIELETIVPIEKHNNGNGVPGYWCGIYVLCPDESTSFSYCKDIAYTKDELSLLEWEELPLESNVDGLGNDGVAFYFDREVIEDKKAFVQLRFGDEFTGKSYDFEIDFSKVYIIK